MKICSPAKNKIKTAYSGLTFKEQCTNLEKVIFHFFHLSKLKSKLETELPNSASFIHLLVWDPNAGSCECVTGKPTDISICERRGGEQDTKPERRILRFRQR